MTKELYETLTQSVYVDQTTNNLAVKIDLVVNNLLFTKDESDALIDKVSRVVAKELVTILNRSKEH